MIYVKDENFDFQFDITDKYNIPVMKQGCSSVGKSSFFSVAFYYHSHALTRITDPY